MRNQRIVNREQRIEMDKTHASVSFFINYSLFVIHYSNNSLFTKFLYYLLNPKDNYLPFTSMTTYSDLHPVLKSIAQSEIPDVTIKSVDCLFS